MSEQYPLAPRFSYCQKRQCAAYCRQLTGPSRHHASPCLVIGQCRQRLPADTDNEFGLHAFPILKWDIGHGLIPASMRGKNWHTQNVGPPNKIRPSTLQKPSAVLEKVPQRTLTFILNGHRYLSNDFFIQGLWNCRDLYKTNGSTIVLLGVGFKLPPELANDVVF